MKGPAKKRFAWLAQALRGRAHAATARGARRGHLLDLLRQTIREAGADRLVVLAASLAYCAALSLAPLVVVTLNLVGMVGDRAQAREHVVSRIEGVLGSESGRLIEQVADGARESGASTLGVIVGLATLLVGASAVFVQLQDGLNVIWDVERKPGHGLWVFIRQRLISLAMVASLSFLLLASLLVSAGLSAVTNTLTSFTHAQAVTATVLNVGVSLLGITVLLALLFRHVPDARTAWRDVWVGAAVTAVLFQLGEWGIGQYLGRAHVGSAYGGAASLVVLLVWVYYSALIVFVGAEFTQVYAERRGAGVVPTRYATREKAASRTVKRA